MKKTQKQKRKTWIRILIGLAVVLIIIAVTGNKAGWFGHKTGHKVACSEVTTRTITETVTANGKVQPETEVKISPDVSGEIIKLDVKEGNKVEKGDFLLKIKPDIYESSLDRAEASLNSAKANLSNSRARLEQTKAQFNQTKLNFQRQKQLYDNGTISESEFENAQASYEMGIADVNAAKESVRAAEFSVLSAKATLQEAAENLRKTSVYAPMTGAISKLNVELGERVVGTEMMAGTEMLRIANLNVMEVVVEVNENDIIKVEHNDTADIEVDAYLKKTFKGIVTEIANSATTSGLAADQVTNFEVKIRILSSSYEDMMDDNKQSPFRPGMSATVDIRTETAYNTLAVPIQSVTVRTDSTKIENPHASEKTGEEPETPLKEVVFVYEDGKVNQTDVTTGIQDTEFIQVTSGLKKGQEVVSAPYSLISNILKDGMHVEKVSEKELYKTDKK
ncbi:MAG: efflux RND transporter periplasmic adaptor subunit [Bacteroidales bacterium]